MVNQPELLSHFTICGNKVLFLGQAEYLVLNEDIDLQNSIHIKILMDEGVLFVPKSVKRGIPQESILVIEPHLDDCALSCTGYILRALEKGANITLLNIFSKATLDTFPWRASVKITEENYEQLRLHESEAMCAYLDLRFQSYRLSQALKRGYPSPFSRIDERDQELVQFLLKKLTEEVKPYQKVLYPLGIQEHTDHVLVHDALDTVEKSNFDKKFLMYEDYPYASNKSAYQKRIEEVAKKKRFKVEYVCIDNYLEQMVDCASIYQSQFDDINRAQMKAVFQDQFRAVTWEGLFTGFKLRGELYQRVQEVSL